MTDREPPLQPAMTGMPIGIDGAGQPIICCDAAVVMLRVIADITERLTRDDNPADLAAAIRIEADALECRAIAHTTGTVHG